MALDDPRSAFIRESQWHGPLDQAAAILAAHPAIATGDIIVAAILGDDATVRRFLVADRTSATTPGGPFQRDPLTHLCFSRYLRLDPARSDAFVRAATSLLDAGASPRTGFFDGEHTPTPCFESVLYGAAGVAHHPGLTRLLLDRGADPNDPPAYEVPYHAPESYDNRALAVLVESGRLSPWSLAMMLIRKLDWHDNAGAQYLLQHGADPEYTRDRGWLALPHAIARDASVEMVATLLDFGAHPLRIAESQSAAALAARRGRSDLLKLFAERGFALESQGADRLIAACARQDDAAIAHLRQSSPGLVEAVLSDGGQLLVEFAGNGNSGGISRLLDQGIPIDSRFVEGDGYWDLAPGSTALQNAAWRLRYETLELLLRRGADVNSRNSKGETAIVLALRACTRSYWSGHRSLRAIEPLLAAGADIGGITVPTGYPEADPLFLARGG